MLLENPSSEISQVPGTRKVSYGISMFEYLLRYSTAEGNNVRVANQPFLIHSVKYRKIIQKDCDRGNGGKNHIQSYNSVTMTIERFQNNNFINIITLF